MAGEGKGLHVTELQEQWHKSEIERSPTLRCKKPHFDKGWWLILSHLHFIKCSFFIGAFKIGLGSDDLKTIFHILHLCKAKTIPSEFCVSNSDVITLFCISTVC